MLGISWLEGLLSPVIEVPSMARSMLGDTHTSRKKDGESKICISVMQMDPQHEDQGIRSGNYRT